MLIAKIEIHTFPKEYQEPNLFLNCRRKKYEVSKPSEYVAQLQISSFETNGEYRFNGKTENIALKKLFKEIGNIVNECKEFHKELKDEN